MSWLMNRSVLITGAGGGIGTAACLAFASQGAVVAGLDLKDEWLEPARRLAGKHAERLHAIVGDASDEEDVARAVQRTVELATRLDIAVAAAGVQTVGSVEDTSWDSWQRVIDVNLTGSWLLCKHAIPAMRAAGGGTILCLGSTCGLHPRANLAAYCISKAGVSMLVRIIGREVAHEGIRAVAVCPTAVDTPLGHSMIQGLRERTPDGAPAGGPLEGKSVQRFLAPGEVAETLVWLTSPAAGAITGSSVPLDFGSV